MTQAEQAVSVVEDIVSSCGCDATVGFTESDAEISVSVNGEDLGILIGRRAATLDAIQLLTFMISSKEADEDERKRVTVDVDGYRERRNEELFAQADRANSEAQSSGKPVELEPMTSQERRAVHNYLAEQSGIDTHSVGDDPERRIVVTPTGA